VLPVLLDAMQDNDASVRMGVASGLVIVSRDAKAVVAPLTQLLKDTDESVRNRAAGALGGGCPGGESGSCADRVPSAMRVSLFVTPAVISLAWIGSGQGCRCRVSSPP